MKKFLLGLAQVLLALLINALFMYVILPVFIIGVMAWLWVPLLFEFEGAVVIGIVITILTLVAIVIVDYKLDSY